MPRKAAPPPDISFLTEPLAAKATSLFAAGSNDSVPAVSLALDRLDDNPFQPRDQMEPGALAELAAVIAGQGFQGALAARPHPTQPGRYQLAFGHRRREAARQAGLTTIPVMVRDLTNEEMVEIAITENIQREDLSPLMEARTYGLMSSELGYTHEQIAAAVGKKRGYVENRLRLLRAPADVQALVADKPDTLRAVANLIKVSDPAERAALITSLREGTLRTDDLPGLVDRPAGPVAPDELPAAAARAVSRRVAADPERTPARIGQGKLTGVIRTLRTFDQQAAARAEISLAEFTLLAEARALIETLYTRYAPDAE